MLMLWKKLKQEFIKTFIRGDEIRLGSGFITWRIYGPSWLEIWWSCIKYKIKENATIIQVVTGVLALVVAVLALFK